VAWCGTAGNKYPRSMLRRCFEAHTGPLLRLLKPDIVLACGKGTHEFADSIRMLLPGVSVIETLHYAHCMGKAVERQELRQVRTALNRSRCSQI
jgi:hypothetical protein